MKKLKHAVSVVLINKDNEVLMVSRKHDHSDFGLPGGKVEDRDYSYTHSAQRETLEETGIVPLNLQHVFSHPGTKDGYICHTFIGEYMGEISYDKEKEPHIVKWGKFSLVEAGTFSEFNKKLRTALENLEIYFI